MKIKHLPILFTVNLPLAEFIHILTAFYHLSISLILFTHSLIDGPKYAQVGLNLKKGSHGNFINKCFERFMDKVHVIKESTLTVEQEPLFLPSPSIPRFKILTN